MEPGRRDRADRPFRDVQDGRRVREATDDLNNYEHSKALEVIENYFWQFCDDYIELVKNRAYGTADSTGNVPSEAAVKSARTRWA